MTSIAPRRLLFLALVLFALAGFLLRLVIARHSTGSNDSATFVRFAYGINDPEKGLIAEYIEVPEFNHPPLVGWWAGKCLEKAGDNNGLGFSYRFKLPLIFGDLLAAGLLYDLWRPRRGRLYAALAAAVFAWSIDSILVTAYHCNTDALCAVLVLLCAWLIERWQLHFLAGLALAAALNVKLIPLVVVPPMLLSYRSWPQALRFAAGLALGLTPFLPVLYHAGHAFHRNAIAYNSNVCHWGINFFLLHARDAAASQSTQDLLRWIIDHYSMTGRYLIMGSAALLGLVNHFRPRWNRYQVCALSLGLFLVLTPGFGVQYTAVVIPAMLAVSVGWAAAYATLAGLFLATIYWIFLDKRWWWSSSFLDPLPQVAAIIGLLAWAVLAVWVVLQIRRPAPLDAPDHRSPALPRVAPGAMSC